MSTAAPHPQLDLDPEIASALADGRPVVATMIVVAVDCAGVKSLLDIGLSLEVLAEAAAQAVRDKWITPFLLDRVNALTGGDSLAANIELMLNNARLAAAVAAAYSSAGSSAGASASSTAAGLAREFTPGSPSKSASWVQSIAPWAWAVA